MGESRLILTEWFGGLDKSGRAIGRLGDKEDQEYYGQRNEHCSPPDLAPSEYLRPVERHDREEVEQRQKDVDEYTLAT